ncbi:MAG: AIPR family protein, partial [Anaerolineaceae bacterium]
QKGNINFQISQTVSKEPQNFFVFNNGITALTYEIGTLPDFKIRGISIINGAQTSGAIGNTSVEVANNATVLMRIVECQSIEVVEKIVLYNNTQNEIRPADLRSNDQTQKRLRDEFQKNGISYIHRRSALRTTRFSITTSSIAPILCAFHGDPQTSYRNSKEIFNDDAIYQKVFPIRITANHVYLVKALSNAIDKAKSDLTQKVNSSIATETESQMSETLKYSASKHFLFYIIGSIAEEILGRQVPDLFAWKCRDELITPDNQILAKAWEKCVNSILPLLSNIIQLMAGDDGFYDVPRSRDLSEKASSQLKALIKSLGQTFKAEFKDIRAKTHT